MQPGTDMAEGRPCGVTSRLSARGDRGHPGDADTASGVPTAVAMTRDPTAVPACGGRHLWALVGLAQ